MAVIIQSANGSYRCSECGCQGSSVVTQVIVRSGMRWDVEYACETCDYVMHTGGPGDTPEEIRRILLDQHGAACLQVEKADQVSLLRALRQIFNVPLRDVKQRASSIAAVGEVGTFVEMKFLALRLKDFGVRAKVQ